MLNNDQRKALSARLRSDKYYINFKIRHAHRAYMYAMSMYKCKRYGILKNDRGDIGWQSLLG